MSTTPAPIRNVEDAHVQAGRWILLLSCGHQTLRPIENPDRAPRRIRCSNCRKGNS